MTNRQTLYAKINKFNLQENVKKLSGKNYTRTSNDILITVISNYENNKKVKSPIIKCKCDKLIEVLKKKHILLDSEIDYINS